MTSRPVVSVIFASRDAAKLSIERGGDRARDRYCCRRCQLSNNLDSSLVTSARGVLAYLCKSGDPISAVVPAVANAKLRGDVVEGGRDGQRQWVRTKVGKLETEQESCGDSGRLGTGWEVGGGDPDICECSTRAVQAGGGPLDSIGAIRHYGGELFHCTVDQGTATVQKGCQFDIKAVTIADRRGEEFRQGEKLLVFTLERNCGSEQSFAVA